MVALQSTGGDGVGNVCSPLGEEEQEGSREGRKTRIKKKAKRRMGSGADDWDPVA